VILESPSDGSKPEIQEERVMEVKIFCLSVLGGCGERACELGEAMCDLIMISVEPKFTQNDRDKLMTW